MLLNLSCKFNGVLKVCGYYSSLRLSIQNPELSKKIRKRQFSLKLNWKKFIFKISCRNFFQFSFGRKFYPYANRIKNHASILAASLLASFFFSFVLKISNTNKWKEKQTKRDEVDLCHYKWGKRGSGEDE